MIKNSDFKHKIKSKMAESDILSTTEGTELLQFIYDFPVFAITKLDLQKRKRVKIKPSNRFLLFSSVSSLKYFEILLEIFQFHHIFFALLPYPCSLG